MDRHGIGLTAVVPVTMQEEQPGERDLGQDSLKGCCHENWAFLEKSYYIADSAVGRDLDV